jgi:hypothetical protein
LTARDAPQYNRSSAMGQTFHRSTNTISRVSIFGALLLVAFVFWLMAVMIRSPYLTQANVAREQPVQFSHEHHVTGLGIDCRYCHTTVESAAFAGIPPTKTCMNCHSQIWTEAPELEPVRASFRTGQPIRWTRVHDLPDFVYFDHSIHVNRGVGCVTCHGRVDKMQLMWADSSLHMEWCIQCHRAPENYIRPREEVFTMQWSPPPEGQAALGRELVKKYGIASPQQLTNCSVCHR